MLKDTFLDVPHPVNTSSDQITIFGHRKLVKHINFDKTNVTEEELNAILAAFDVTREAHSLATLKYRLGGHRTRLMTTLVEYLLESQALNNYKIPLCYREVDDDLEVAKYNKAENFLDWDWLTDWAHIHAS